ncbi:hypothetical protein ALQ64_02918 [Pseudomonas cannabina]|uniref:Uncharacterized protein n=1 Tax=Pseudomonas cannabina TaxID=86840 RepID=A0A3M3LJJ1_PSECA|nr:hypothetical protein ALQ64_02918 [Pseudomonas cannabina]
MQTWRTPELYFTQMSIPNCSIVAAPPAKICICLGFSLNSFSTTMTLPAFIVIRLAITY